MGGNASTRRVVVEDAGGEEYVTISEAVAKRLRGQADVESVPRGAPAGETPSVPLPSPPPRMYEPEHKPPQVLRNQEVEDFYMQKLKDLQERNATLQKITNEQFASAVKEVEQKFLNVTASPVCQDLQAKVLECYQTNPGEILNCSGLVSAFTACVDRARMDLLMSHMEDEKILGLLKKDSENVELFQHQECSE